MAGVAQDPTLRRHIDHCLDYLVGEWEALPGLAAEWDGWDRASRRAFVEDWGVPSDRLGQLRRWAAEGHLTPDQRQRWSEVEQLVAHYSSTLERLLAG